MEIKQQPITINVECKPKEFFLILTKPTQQTKCLCVTMCSFTLNVLWHRERMIGCGRRTWILVFFFPLFFLLFKTLTVVDELFAYWQIPFESVWKLFKEFSRNSFFVPLQKWREKKQRPNYHRRKKKKTKSRCECSLWFVNCLGWLVTLSLIKLWWSLFVVIVAVCDHLQMGE